MARYSPSGNFILRRFKENVVERRNQPNTTPSWKRSSTRGSKTTSDTLVTRKAVTSIQPSAPTTSLTVEGKTVTKRWLYHTLNYKRVLIDSFLWSIGGLTPRWHHREQYFAFLSQKKNRFYVAGGLHCSDKSQKTPKCGKKISGTLGCALYATFLCSYHALISVICYCTDARQHEIYLLSCTYANHTSTSSNRLSFLLPSERRLNASNQVIIIIIKVY